MVPLGCSFVGFVTCALVVGFSLLVSLAACARVVGGVLVVSFHCPVCGLGFSLVGLHVGLFVGSGLMVSGLLCFGCWLLLLRGGKTFAIYLVVLYRADAPFLCF